MPLTEQQRFDCNSRNTSSMGSMYRSVQFLLCSKKYVYWTTRVYHELQYREKSHSVFYSVQSQWLYLDNTVKKISQSIPSYLFIAGQTVHYPAPST